jgi:hypothetical protein
MGYYVDTTEAVIFIYKDKFEDCYKAMCKLNERDDLKSGGSWREGKAESKWFSWMDANYPEKCKSMEDILHELGFEGISYDEEGNLIDLCYSNKIGSEEHFFQSIAPFIKEGSYINWSGEDNSMWQWYFNGKELVTKSAHITWSE